MRAGDIPGQNGRTTIAKVAIEPMNPAHHSSNSQLIDGIAARARRLFVPLLAFSVFVNVLALVMPIYMLQIYDRVLPSRNLTTLLLLTLVALLLLLVQGLLSHYRSRIVARFGAAVCEGMSHPIFDGMLKNRLAVSQAEDQLDGDLDKLSRFFADGSLLRLFDAPWTPIFLGVVFLLHPLLGGVASVLALVLLLTDWLGDRSLQRRMQRAAIPKGQAEFMLKTGLRKAAEFWSMGLDGKLREAWQEKHRQSLAGQGDLSNSKSVYREFRRTIQQSAQMAMLGFGAFLAVQDKISAGAIVAGSIICARALAPLSGLVGAWHECRQARELFDRLKVASSDVPPDGGASAFLAQHIRTSAFHSRHGSLRARGLLLDFGPKANPDRKAVDFHLDPGQTIAVCGASPLARSLLVETLMGARPPAAGRVSLGEISLHRVSSEVLGRLVGYASRNVSLIEGTFAENIARFGDIDPAGLDRAIDRVGLRPLLERLPEGYDTSITTAASYLDPAQLRLVGIARALYGDPALLVLDNVDEGFEASSYDMLINVVRGGRSLQQITVCSTANTQLAKEFDRVLFIKKDGMMSMRDMTEITRSTPAADLVSAKEEP